MEISNYDDDFDEDTQKGKYLTFIVENEAYGIGIGYVREIIGILPISEVPEMPNYIKGIVNLRGQIIPVVDVRLRFKKEEQEYDERTCIIVIDVFENTVGLIVDCVSEVLSIADDHIVSQPVLSSNVSNRYVDSIGKVDHTVKLLLNCEKLLTQSELDASGVLS